jgi:GDP-L-fucose synthase
MKIIVTGGNGCVGSALKELCLNDKDWIFINRNDCDLINREETIKLFNSIKPDYIIHLASYVPGFYNINKVASFSNNVRINENILEASNISGINSGMFCLSVNMISDTQTNFPINEESIFEGVPTGVFEGYSYSKRMLAMQCQNYNEQYNRKYFGIIPCNIYGPNDNLMSGRLIPNLISKFKTADKNNEDVIINGTGNPLRQFLYSVDLANIIKKIVLSNYSNTKPIICCSDDEISISNLANKIAKIIKFKHKIIFDISKKDGNLRKTVSNDYLKSILPDFSFTSLSSGLERTINSLDHL